MNLACLWKREAQVVVVEQALVDGEEQYGPIMKRRPLLTSGKEVILADDEGRDVFNVPKLPYCVPVPAQ